MSLKKSNSLTRTCPQAALPVAMDAVAAATVTVHKLTGDTATRGAMLVIAAISCRLYKRPLTHILSVLCSSQRQMFYSTCSAMFHAKVSDRLMPYRRCLQSKDCREGAGSYS